MTLSWLKRTPRTTLSERPEKLGSCIPAADFSAIKDALQKLSKGCTQQVLELTDDKENERLAQTVHSIQALHEWIVTVVKAPEATRLDPPAPNGDSNK